MAQRSLFPASRDGYTPFIMGARLDFSGKRVVVTGASSGLGREIARTLAYTEHSNLVIAARRRERLEALKAEIESRSPSRVSIVCVDLGTPEGPETLFREACAGGEVYALVNCAGLTYWGKSLEAPVEKTAQILQVDLVAEVKTCLLFLGHFLSAGRGGILTITSVMAFTPGPYQNAYAAAKHGIQTFMEGLAIEYRGKGIVFSTFAPGGIATELLASAGIDGKFSADNPVNADPRIVAADAVRAFKRGRLVTIPGALYRTATTLARFAPRRLVAWFMERLYRP